MNIKKTIKNSLYGFYTNPLSKILYNNEIKNRSQLHLDEIIPLSQKINMFSPFSPEIHKPNDWYGHAKIFKQFLGLSKNYQFKFIIEHGLHLVKDVLDIELETNLPSFVTYSDFRANVIKKYKKNVFCVGPFIHYAPHYLTTQQLLNEKGRLGKTILLFPSHSSGDLDFKYDIKALCKKVEKLARNHNSIRVCLYWKDVLLGHAKFYKSFGFECVTAGHILDPLFLPRLKSIIETSDLTISNIAGNHVGYCIFMNKPHIILPQIHKISGRRSEKKLLEDVWWKSKSYIEVVNTFSKVFDRISQKQQQIVDYYWGVSKIKTKKEFMNIIKKTEEIYKTYKKQRYD